MRDRAWITLLPLGIALAYVSAYIFLRASGRLQFDGNSDASLAYRGDPTRHTFEFAPKIESWFWPAASCERHIARFTTRKSQFGYAEGIRYQGNYSPERAKQTISAYLSTFPSEATKISGKYDCAYYDDKVDVQITFHLPKKAWGKWRPLALASLKKMPYGSIETLEESDSRLYVDYGGSSEIWVDYAEPFVTFTRHLND